MDLTRRIHKKYKTLYYPCVSIYHTFTRGSRKSLRLLIIHIQSIIKYFNKWGWIKDEERKKINRNVMQQIGGIV